MFNSFEWYSTQAYGLPNVFSFEKVSSRSQFGTNSSFVTVANEMAYCLTSNGIVSFNGASSTFITDSILNVVKNLGELSPRVDLSQSEIFYNSAKSEIIVQNFNNSTLLVFQDKLFLMDSINIF